MHASELNSDIDGDFLGELKRAYEIGRVRLALWAAVPVVAFVVASIALAGPGSATYVGAGLYVTCAFLVWRGGSLGRGVSPGLLAGAIPFGLAHASSLLGHVCVDGGCYSWCMPACAVGGLLAGLFVSAVALRARLGFSGWLSASAIVACCGLMGCQCVGYSSLAGLALGHIIATAGYFGLKGGSSRT